MRVRGYGILYAVLAFIAGCAPMAEIDIEVMKPAVVELPPEIRQIAFLNRSVIPTLIHHDSTEWTAEEYYILDTILNNRMFSGVRRVMDDSPLFDLDSMRVVRSRRYDTAGLLDPLTGQQMEQVRNLHSADALLSLEYFKMNEDIDIIYIDYEEIYEAYRGIYLTTLWRIYDLNSEQVLDAYWFRDTTEWYAYHRDSQLAVSRLPLAVDAIRQAAFEHGSRYARRISPSWFVRHRFYHIHGGRKMREAGEMVAAGDWESAAGIWEELAAGENQSVAAKAAFNMALYFEVKDGLIPALDWIIESYAIRQKPLTKEYIDILRKRYADYKLLREQLPAGSQGGDNSGQVRCPESRMTLRVRP